MDGNEGEHDIEIIRYTRNVPTKVKCVAIPPNVITKQNSIIKVVTPVHSTVKPLRVECKNVYYI